MRAALALAAFLILAGVALAILVASGLLFTFIALLGIAIVVPIIAGSLVAGVLLIVAVPYYFMTKPAGTVPGEYRLGQLKGR